MMSAVPRWRMRTASSRATSAPASEHVSELLGPWASHRMPAWQACMFGRCFKSHSGDICPMPAAPQSFRSTRPSDRAARTGSARSSSVVGMNDVPKIMPNRAWLMVGRAGSPAAGSPRGRPVSRTAWQVAPMANWMSRAMTLRFFLM